MTQRERVLNMLRDAGSDGVSSNDFFRACLPRFSARVHELRNAGHTITKEPVEQGHFLYRLVKVSAAPTSVDRESLDDRGADLGQSEAQRAEGAGDLTQVGSRVPSESSTSLGDRSSSPDPQDAAVAEPRQVTDADGSPGRDPSASLLLFDMPVDRYADAA
jgi:hypothetical protein